MVQDFAKIRPEPVLERRQMTPPQPWALLGTGLVTGIAVGVFGCFLFYLSGKVPPLQTATPATIAEVIPESTTGSGAEAAELTTAQSAEVRTGSNFELQFYTELPSYEVVVPAVPVALPELEIGNQIEVTTAGEADTAELNNELADVPASPVVLQTGAYRERSRAESQRDQLQNLGIAAVVKQESINGRSLFLVQAGPFPTARQLSETERTLNSNRITHIRMLPR